jgi:hypothetical protein
MSLNAVCTLSAHCAGLDTNNLIFWTYWSTHGFYTKRSPPRGNLVFHVVRYFLFDTPNFFFAFEIVFFLFLEKVRDLGIHEGFDLRCLIILSIHVAFTRA